MDALFWALVIAVLIIVVSILGYALLPCLISFAITFGSINLGAGIIIVGFYSGISEGGFSGGVLIFFSFVFGCGFILGGFSSLKDPPNW